MSDQNVSSLVLGEAPESDEEYELSNIENAETTFSPTAELVSSVVGMAVIGEAVEFDDEIEFPKSEGKSASKLDRVPAIANKMQSTSLKKLRERNKMLYESLTNFKKQILNSTNHGLNSINQQLLKSQVELQQTLMNVRSVKANLVDFQKKVNDIIIADYIPVINIKVPAPII